MRRALCIAATAMALASCGYTTDSRPPSGVGFGPHLGPVGPDVGTIAPDLLMSGIRI